MYTFIYTIIGSVLIKLIKLIDNRYIVYIKRSLISLNNKLF